MTRFRPLPPLRIFEEDFRRKFGRDLTETERNFWYLAEELLEEHGGDEPDPSKAG